MRKTLLVTVLCSLLISIPQTTHPAVPYNIILPASVTLAFDKSQLTPESQDLREKLSLQIVRSQTKKAAWVVSAVLSTIIAGISGVQSYRQSEEKAAALLAQLALQSAREAERQRVIPLQTAALHKYYQKGKLGAELDKNIQLFKTGKVKKTRQLYRTLLKKTEAYKAISLTGYDKTLIEGALGHTISLGQFEQHDRKIVAFFEKRDRNRRQTNKRSQHIRKRPFRGPINPSSKQKNVKPMKKRMLRTRVS